MIGLMEHWSLNNPATIYDEEALTVVQLVARLAAKFNELIVETNNHDEAIAKLEKYVNTELSTVMHDTAKNVINTMIENGSLAELVINNRVNAKDFGATGNGVTDDSQAIREWLNFIGEGGLTGFLPNGNYLIDCKGLQLKSHENFSIQGESRENTKLVFELAVDDEVQLNHIDLRFCDNVHLKDFSIVCSGGDMQTTGVGLYLVDCNHSTFENIDILNCSRCGVCVYSATYQSGGTCDSLYFDNVNVYGVPNNAYFDATRKLYPMGWILTDCVNTLVNNSRIEGIRHYGFELKNYCKNTYFMNCYAKNCASACHIGGELRTGDIYGVQGCGFKNIQCYNVDQPILGGSFRECVFENISAYYSDDYEWSNIEGYSLRLENVLNSYFEVSLYNIPYGGLYATDIFQNNYVRFKYLSVSSSYEGRVFMFAGNNCFDNVVKVEGRHPTLSPDRLNARIGNNVMIDTISGNVTNNMSGDLNLRKYVSIAGTDSPNTGGGVHESAPTLKRSFYSGDGEPEFNFGDVKNGNNINVRFNNNAGQLEIRIYKDGSLKGSTIIKPTEITHV